MLMIRNIRHLSTLVLTPLVNHWLVVHSSPFRRDFSIVEISSLLGKRV
jgi:hypothetical protein